MTRLLPGHTISSPQKEILVTTLREALYKDLEATAYVWENNSPIELKELCRIFKLQQNISNLKNCPLKNYISTLYFGIWNNSDTQHFYLAKLLLEIAQVGEMWV